MVQEIDENRFRRRLGERFFRSESFFCRFWGPTWVPDRPLWSDFRPTFATFWPTLGHHVFFLRSRVLGDSAGIDFECLRVPPGRDFQRILDYSWRRFGHSLHLSFVPTSSQVCPNSRSVVALPLVLALVGLPFSCRGGGPRSVVNRRGLEPLQGRKQEAGVFETEG